MRKSGSSRWTEELPMCSQSDKRKIQFLPRNHTETSILQWRENALLSVSLECKPEKETAAQENRGSQATPHQKLVMTHCVGPVTKTWGQPPYAQFYQYLPSY